MISIVGLGVELGNLTEGAKNQILSGKKIVLKSKNFKTTQSVKSLGVEFTTLDYIYDKSRNFDSLNKNLANAVLNLAKESDVVYCVNGSVIEDISAQLIIKRSKNVQVFDGVSKCSNAFSIAKIFNRNKTCVSAYDIYSYKRASLPLAVYDLDSDLIAGDIKIHLCDMLGDETPCYFVCNGKSKKIKLYELDRQKNYDYSTVLVIDDIPLLKKSRFDFYDLVEVMQKLRAPDGCPWDRAQTHESIRKNMIEEAYELVDAIDCGDDDKIIEETGDVLMQAVFHSELGQERGAFSGYDITTGVCDKLIFRHSHIFGTDNASDADGALSVWENNKKKEKGQKTASDSVLDVPKVFPALIRAQKVGKRAAKSGYDFKDFYDATTKIPEELSEVISAYKSGNEKEIYEEIGDLLFSVVNVGRLAGVDCEESLTESTEKFVRRFLITEKLVLADNKKMEELSYNEIWEYYEKAKEYDKKDKNR